VALGVVGGGDCVDGSLNSLLQLMLRRRVRGGPGFEFEWAVRGVESHTPCIR
jgi:hypothetical protein